LLLRLFASNSAPLRDALTEEEAFGGAGVWEQAAVASVSQKGAPPKPQEQCYIGIGSP